MAEPLISGSIIGEAAAGLRLPNFSEPITSVNPLSPQNRPNFATVRLVTSGNTGSNPVFRESWSEWRQRVGGSIRLGTERVAEVVTGNRAAMLVRSGVENWVKNLNPVGKDRYWFAGITTGGVATVAMNELVFGSVATYMRTGVVLAASFAASSYLKHRYIGQQVEARRTFTENDLTNRLAEIENEYTTTAGRVKRFMMGVSAGATYGGLASAFAGEVIHESIKSVTDSYNVSGAEESLIASHQDVSSPSEADTIAKTITLPSGSNPTEAVTKFLTEELHRAPSASEVQEGVVKFMEQNNITDAHNVAADVAFKAEGLVLQPGEVSPEGLINEALNKMDVYVGGVPESIVKGAEQIMESGLKDSVQHDVLVNNVQIFLEKSINDNAGMFQNLLSNTSNFTEIAIPSGSNVGNILDQAGHHISWTPDNAELFGSEIAINFDMLTNYWGLMDKVGYLPKGTHFPATIGELYQLIERAKGGDSASLDSLKLMLRYVPSGMKLRVLNEAGVTSVIGALKVLAKAA